MAKESGQKFIRRVRPPRVHITYENPANAEEKVEIGIGYMTRTYRRKPGELGGKLGVIIAGSAPNWRNGVIVALENDTWTVSVGGFLGGRNDHFCRKQNRVRDEEDPQKKREVGSTRKSDHGRRREPPLDDLSSGSTVDSEHLIGLRSLAPHGAA